MFVLTRNSGQAIVLETSDGPVIIQINKMQGRQFKVALDAPKTIKIRRMEVKQEAAQ